MTAATTAMIPTTRISIPTAIPIPTSLYLKHVHGASDNTCSPIEITVVKLTHVGYVSFMTPFSIIVIYSNGNSFVI